MRAIAQFSIGLALTLATAACGGGSAASLVDGAASDVAFLKAEGGLGKDIARAIGVFADGSSVVAGEFGDTVLFSPGDPASQSMDVLTGNNAVSIARYAPDGTLQWVHSIVGDDEFLVGDVATLADGSCLVVGTFYGHATFAKGFMNEVTFSDVDGFGDIFVAKYGADGVMHWARRAGRNDADLGHAIAAHSDGSFVIGGTFQTLATFGTGQNTLVLTSNGQYDSFVARYDSSGGFLWARSVGGTEADGVSALAVLPDDSILAVGGFRVSMILGSGEPTQTALASGGGTDLFVAKYASTGDLLWARREGGSGSTYPRDIAVSADSSFALGGYFTGSATFGLGQATQADFTATGMGDAFLSRHNADGTLRWVRKDSSSVFVAISRIALRTDGVVAAVGSFRNTATFGMNEPAETSLTSDGMTDGFAMFVQPDGTLRKVLHVSSVAFGGMSDIAVNEDGSWGVCGAFAGLAIFQPTVFPIALSSAGDSDMFVGRINANGGF